MEENNTVVRVDRIPNCDLCMDPTPAEYDAKSRQGPWGYMCEEHFQRYGIGLGMGRGQRLKLRGK